MQQKYILMKLHLGLSRFVQRLDFLQVQQTLLAPTRLPRLDLGPELRI